MFLNKRVEICRGGFGKRKSTGEESREKKRKIFSSSLKQGDKVLTSNAWIKIEKVFFSRNLRQS